MNILFDATDKQVEFLSSVFNPLYDTILYGGSIRGGKTFGGLQALILLCKKYPNSRWIVVRKTLPLLKVNTIPSFNKLNPENFFSHWDSGTGTAFFKNGSGIMFFSENFNDDKELNRWKGLECNGFLLEEVNELQEQSFYKAIERAGTWIIPDMPPKKIICTCNPAQNWVKKLFYDRWRKQTLPPKWLYIPSRIFDNPHIPKEYIESLKILPPITYQKFVEGDWDVIENEMPFVDQFSYDKHISEDAVYDPNYDIYVCFDFNIVNTVLIIQNTETSIYVIKEYHVKGWDLQRLCSEIATDYPECFYLINGDASGKSRSALTSGNQTGYEMIKEFLNLSWRQFYVQDANPSHQNSRFNINFLFKNYPILIHPSCEGLIRDLQGVRVINGGKIDKSDEDLTHFLDPLRYHLYFHHQDKVKLLRELFPE